MHEFEPCTYDSVAFCDIDGVFNHEHWDNQYRFMKESVQLINKLYKQYKIGIVLSSSWRQSYTFDAMNRLFRINRIKAPLIDKTYIVTSNKIIESISLEELMNLDINKILTRENEILEWIRLFKPKHFIIFDDFIMKDSKLKNHQVLTSYYGKRDRQSWFKSISL